MSSTSAIPKLIQNLHTKVDTDFIVADDLQQPVPETESDVSSQVTSEPATLDDTNNDIQVPKIVAAGRGGALSLPAIFDKVIELSRKDKPNIVYLGTASFDRDDKYEIHVKKFRQHGCAIERLKVSVTKDVPSEEELRRLVVDWADVIVCAAGNTLHALLRWKEVGLDILMKEAAESGTVLCGGSAGAGCWFDSLHSDSLRPDNVKRPEIVQDSLDEDELTNWDFIKISGMGYINTMCVPHFDATGSNNIARSEHAQEMLAEQTDASAIGIDENAALVLEGDKAMVVSGDGKATCHIVVTDEETGGTASVPIPSTEEPFSLDEIMELPEPSETLPVEELEKFVETDFAVAEELQQPPPANDDTSRSSLMSSSVGTSVPKIVAAGRGGALSLPTIFNKVIDLSGKDKPNVVYIGTASFDRSDKFQRHMKAFQDHGCETKRLCVSEAENVPPLEDMRWMIVEWADVLVCAAGNTLHALLRWKEVGLDILMKEAAEKGTVLAGGSAGAGCWFDSLHSDSLRPDNVKNSERIKSELDEDDLADWDYVKISGMGYINAMCVPHFDATGSNDVSRAEHAQEMLSENPDALAIGIDENAAFVVEGDKAMVVSGDGEATCHVVVSDEQNGGTASVPISLTFEEPVPLEELLDLPEPSDAPHFENLEEHVETDFKVADDLQDDVQQLPPNGFAGTEDNDTEQRSSEEEEVVPKIVAAGRMKALQLPAIVDKVIELTGKDKPNVLYVGTASFDRTDKYNMVTKTFRELECEIERLNVSEVDDVPPEEEMRQLVVEWADVLLCSGGNTLHALLRWKEVGLDLLMKEASEKGTVLAGASAGAGCWFDSLHSDSLRPDNVKNSERIKSELDEDGLADWDYVKISGMGYINAMCVPHFDATGSNDVSRAEHAQEIMAEHPDAPAIGIDENAAFVVEGDKAMVVSGDGEATCHVVVPDEDTGGMISTPILLAQEAVSLEDMLDVSTN